MLDILDIAIIGTGPAGLTAAIYAARAGLNPVIFAGLLHGGQLSTTTEVENFPGFSDGIMGPELMTTMASQAERFGTKIFHEEVTKVDFSKQPFSLYVGEKEVKSKVVIIANGAVAKTLVLPKEAALIGRGVSTCATCDGFFYRNKKVIVVGGGDSAMEESLYLSKLASEVILVHRRPDFRASKIMAERVKNSSTISLKIPYEVVDFVSDAKGFTGAILKNTQTQQLEEVKADGFFYAIGHTPNSKLFKDFLDMDDQGYLKIHDFMKTKIPGVFVAGDIADKTFRQAITAAGMGCQAAMQAIRYLEEQEK